MLLRGGYMVRSQVLQIATLSAFTTYAVGIFEPIQMTAANIAEFISLQASIERVTGLLDEKPQIADTPEVIARYGDALPPQARKLGAAARRHRVPRRHVPLPGRR